MALAVRLATRAGPLPVENSGQAVDAPGLKYFVFALFVLASGLVIVQL